MGAAFWGVASDVWGRRCVQTVSIHLAQNSYCATSRWAFNITLCITGIFATAAGGSPNYIALCSLAAVWSIGVGGNLPVDSAVFLGELLVQTRSSYINLTARRIHPSITPVLVDCVINMVGVWPTCWQSGMSITGDHNLSCTFSPKICRSPGHSLPISPVPARLPQRAPENPTKAGVTSSTLWAGLCSSFGSFASSYSTFTNRPST